MKNQFFKIFIIFLLFNILNAISTTAQLKSHGKEFLISGYHFGNEDFIIYSEFNTTVYFHFFNNPSQDFSMTINAHDFEIVYLENAINALYNMHEDAVIDNRSLQITSDCDIVVYQNLSNLYADDGSLIYPVDQPFVSSNLDTFYLITPGDNEFSTLSFSTTIVSHFDSVEIELLLNQPFHGQPAGIPFIKRLNKGEVFNIREAHDNINYTGSRIVVLNSEYKNAISVYNSQLFTMISYPEVPITTSFCCADNILEQIPAIQAFDTIYHAFPYMIAGSEMGIPGAAAIPPYIRVISAEDGNNIYKDNVLLASLNAGEYWNFVITEPCILTSDKRMAVSQFTPSFSEVSIFGDPFSTYGDPDHLILHSLNQGIREATIKLPDLYSGSNVVRVMNVISETAGLNVFMDGISVNGEFNPFPSAPQYSYAQILLPHTGPFHINADNKFVAYLQTFYIAGGTSFALGGFSGDEYIGIDSTIFFCDSINLKGRIDADSLVWGDGYTGLERWVSNTGVYTVLSYVSCTIVEDTYRVQRLDIPELTINDTIVCDANQLYLDVKDDLYKSYLWSTGDTTSDITIKEAGNYKITITPKGKYCPEFTEEFNVVFAHPLEFSWYNDTVVCYGNTLNLKVLLDNVDILWNTGDTSCCITVDTTGIYRVMVKNICGSTEKSVQINYYKCDYCLNIPNAFSPNNDGINDEFKVVTACVFDKFTLEIFNRWGERVFFSVRPEIGWDGTIKGEKAEGGVYYYRITVSSKIANISDHVEKGDLTLLR